MLSLLQSTILSLPLSNGEPTDDEYILPGLLLHRLLSLLLRLLPSLQAELTAQLTANS